MSISHKDFASRNQFISEHLSQLSDEIARCKEENISEIVNCIVSYKALPGHMNDDIIDLSIGDIAMVKGFISAKTEKYALVFVERLQEEIKFLLNHIPSLKDDIKKDCVTLVSELEEFAKEIKKSRDEA